MGLSNRGWARLLVGVPGALLLGALLLSATRPELARAAWGWLLLGGGVLTAASGTLCLVSGLRARGSPSPSLGPGLGAALLIGVGAAGLPLGLGLALLGRWLLVR